MYYNLLNILKHLPFRIVKYIINKYKLVFVQKKHILKSEIYSDSILTLKSKSIERVYFSTVFDFVEKSHIDFQYPEINIQRYFDAEIYAGSDFIVLKEGVIWDKYFRPQWAKIIPLDNELLKVEKLSIFIEQNKNTVNIDSGYSLCGVHCKTWAHFIVQYLPKLYLLEKLQSIVEYPLTLIIPQYNDRQIYEIVYSSLAKFRNLKIIELKPNEVAHCKILYHVENTSLISDHSRYINPSDIVIPKFTIALLKQNLINPLIEKVTNLDKCSALPSRKLFLGREGKNRNIMNYVEIEIYFKKQGFEIVYPHRLSLEKKVNTFREAAIIVGPYSSGFTNIIFCKPGTKALAFVNFQRIFDGYGPTIANYFGINLTLVTGIDVNDSIHSSYFISMERIEAAYLSI